MDTNTIKRSRNLDNRREPWQYDAPMYHDFEQESPSYGRCSVDKWFDTSATKGLQSPVSGRDGDDGDVKDDVSSKVYDDGLENKRVGKKVVDDGPGKRTRRVALGNLTNTFTMAEPVVPQAAPREMIKKKVEEEQVVVEETMTKKVVEQGPVKETDNAEQVVYVVEKARKVVPPAPKTRSQTKKKQKITSVQNLTVPKSPMLLSRIRSTSHRKVVKSSEELEMEEIERKRKEVAKLKQKSAKRENAGMIESLTSNNNAGGAKRKKTHHDVLLKDKVGGFSIGTSGPVTRSQNKPWNPKLTCPKSPNFATNRRARPPRFKSSEEIELERISKAAKSIKATLTRAKTNALTIPEPFSFETEKRATGSRIRSNTSDVGLKPFIFGEGPVTRSKSKHVVHMTRVGPEKKKTKPVPTVQEQKRMSSPKALPLSKTNDNDVKPVKSCLTRTRPVTRGSLLKGGAMRVVRKEVEEEENVVHDDGNSCADKEESKEEGGVALEDDTTSTEKV